MLAALTIIAIAVPIAGLAFLCAGLHVPGIKFKAFLRETLMPLSKREFWFPPCPLCWAVRVAALALVVYPFIPLSVAQSG